MNQIVSNEERLKNSQIKVVVGMSGGVDSSVCAALLKDQGYEVIGLFMKNWEETDEKGVCKASLEFADVEKVCDVLDIPCYSLEFIKEYRDHVFAHFLKEYEQGFTPNPDILCNKEIKFKVFYEKARSLGAAFLATGHYCQKEEKDGRSFLLKGFDKNKDQSYFLYTMREEVLKNVIFPIGHLTKPQVRSLASYYHLPTHDKKDSTGICFIGERNFKNFLSQYLAIKPGQFKTLKGEVVGTHSGVAYYTLGQRKGLGLGGEGEAWFVVKKDPAHNIVYVERGDNHPALFSKSLVATELHFINADDKKGKGIFCCKAKIRYRQQDVDCTVKILEGENQKALVTFSEAQRAITERQSVVFYQGEKCLGGGIIESKGPDLYEQPNQ